jgi:hypothetical protein
MLGGIFVGCYTVYLISEWIRDLRFYHSINWDFRNDSGRKMIPGGPHLSMKGMNPVSNKQRVLLGYPLMIAVGIISTILIFFREFWGGVNI